MTVIEAKTQLTNHCNVLQDQDKLLDIQIRTPAPWKPWAEWVVVIMHKGLANLVRDGKIEQYTYFVNDIGKEAVKYNRLDMLKDSISKAAKACQEQWQRIS